MAGLELTYLAGADIDALALPADDILGGGRRRARRPGTRRDRDRAPRPPLPGRRRRRALQRPARRPAPGRRRRREGGGRLRRKPRPRPAVGAGAAHALRRLHRRADGDPGRDRDHRDAHGRRDRRRRPPPGPPGEPRARPHRQPRHRGVERAPALPRPARHRGGAHPLAHGREPHGARRPPRARARPGRARRRRLGGVRPRRRHRGRGDPARRPPSRCCAPSGSPRAHWSSPTAR